ncbi:uncharacterized protein LOC124494279 isoform X2 [Dermatophagoides farinae]|uniref:uncharacterized protein LOC124494279 isoform X2 n=1 Tax=Dermatophagoides farinae TaxID=6954 RepID=UPI003F640C04
MSIFQSNNHHHNIMAVFLTNICAFDSCGKKFASLPELIKHIEEHHIDVEAYDNAPTKPSYNNCMPVSCVLRMFSDRNDDSDQNSGMAVDSNGMNDSHHNNNNNHNYNGIHHHVRKSINSPAASLSTTPTGSELDDDAGFESDSGQSSIDSWANVDTSNTNALTKFHQIMGSNVSSPTVEQTTNVGGILQNGTTMIGNGQMATNSSKMMMNSGGGKNVDEKRLYYCNVVGCNKQYRTSNSLSHHRRSAHINKDNNKISLVMGGHNNNNGGGCQNNGPSNGHPMTPKTPTLKPMLDENNKKVYRCICGKVYKTSHGLKSHLNTHHHPDSIHQYVQNYQQQQPQDIEMTSIIHQKPDTFAEINSTTSSSSSSMTNNGGNGVHLSSIKAELLSPTITNLSSSSSSLQSNKMINIGHNTTTVHFNQNDLIPDQSCPPVSVNVEVTSEPKQTNFLSKNSSPPIISAPTLQQHLLSPVIPKVIN